MEDNTKYEPTGEGVVVDASNVRSIFNQVKLKLMGVEHRECIDITDQKRLPPPSLQCPKK